MSDLEAPLTGEPQPVDNSTTGRSTTAHRNLRHGFLWWRGQWAIWAERGWYGVRMRGWQFDVKNHRVHRPLFSERYGYGKRDYRHVGPFCFRFGRLTKP